MSHCTLPASAGHGELVVHYRDVGRRDAPVLLLLHELGGSLETWTDCADLLAQSMRVIAFDQRGAGLSSRDGMPFTLRDLGDDVARVIDALQLPTPLVLMGLAMGAVTALHFAADHRMMVSGLVLCDGPAGMDGRTSRYLRSRADAARADGMVAVAGDWVKGAFRGLDGDGRRAAAEYEERLLRASPAGFAAQLEALAGDALDPALVARIDTPALVLTGRHDAIWPPSQGEALAASLPNARFRVVEEAAHLPPLQAPGRTSGLVIDFLSEQKTAWT